jgi:peroxiredoxin
MAQWAAEEGFQYEVWTDDDATLALYYGAVSSASASYPARVTMLLDGDGDLILEYTEDVVFGTHPEEVYQDCVSIFGE